MSGVHTDRGSRGEGGVVGDDDRRTVLFVVGTRPEAIKLAPVILAARDRTDLKPFVLSTGQHREMLAQVFGLFEIVPDEDLAIMKPGQDLFDVTSSVLLGMRDVIRKHRPDVIVVQGDTTSCFVGALAAFYEGVPVAHVEAGLRTYDLAAPFPEEANRQLASRIATIHFPPTEGSATHLRDEGIDPGRITVTGNTVIDALLWVRDRLSSAASGADAENDLVTRGLSALHTAWPQIESDRPYVLITGHRRENFGGGFESLCQAIADLAGAYPDWNFVYPVHLNPRVQEPVKRILGGIANVSLIVPQDYAPFVRLMDGARFILTDSGGVQEEAPSLGKPVLVMREKTERPEAVEAGTVRLVGTDRQTIVAEAKRLIEDADHYAAMAHAHNPYGDGRASERILDAIAAHLAGESNGSPADRGKPDSGTGATAGG
jgi:UDP-N-acetylglucosamine 2-epimerase (non-hydrolysing)